MFEVVSKHWDTPNGVMLACDWLTHEPRYPAKPAIQASRASPQLTSHVTFRRQGRREAPSSKLQVPRFKALAS
jgi:hypothetical protein